MRFFDLLNLQHLALFFFPTVIFIILLAVALGTTYFHTKDSEKSIQEIHHVFPGDIGERDGPVPLVLILIIVGFIVWAFFYTLGRAIIGVAI